MKMIDGAGTVPWSAVWAVTTQVHESQADHIVARLVGSPGPAMDMPLRVFARGVDSLADNKAWISRRLIGGQ